MTGDTVQGVPALVAAVLLLASGVYLGWHRRPGWAAALALFGFVALGVAGRSLFVHLVPETQPYRIRRIARLGGVVLVLAWVVLLGLAGWLASRRPRWARLLTWPAATAITAVVCEASTSALPLLVPAALAYVSLHTAFASPRTVDVEEAWASVQRSAWIILAYVGLVSVIALLTPRVLT